MEVGCRLLNSKMKDGGFVTISTDITELKQHEKELEEQRKCMGSWWRLSMGWCSIGIWITTNRLFHQSQSGIDSRPVFRRIKRSRCF